MIAVMMTPGGLALACAVSLTAFALWLDRRFVDLLSNSTAAPPCSSRSAGFATVSGAHDAVIQSLIGLILRLHSIADRTSGDARQALCDTLDRADQLLAHELSSVERLTVRWDRASLAAQLQEEAGRALASGSIAARLIVIGRPRALRPRATAALLAVAREAFSNTARHSRATHIEIELSFERTGLTVRLSDDGCGLPADRVERGKLHGYSGLARLVSLGRRAGGGIQLTSAHGKGVEIAVMLPSFMAYC